MPTTTNYGWTTPADTDLVKDGASAIRTLGSSIDSTLKTQIDAQIPDSLLTTTGDIIYASGASTPARLGIGSSGQSLVVSGGLPVWATPASGGMTLISTTTLTGASITLSSIPSTYNHLQVVIQNFKPATDAQAIKMRFNADATANRHYNLIGTGNVDGGFGTDSVQVSWNNDNAVANGLCFISFPNYANTTTWKMCFTQAMGVSETTTTNLYGGFFQGYYNQTGAISSLSFFPASGNFTSGTVLLYGVK